MFQIDYILSEGLEEWVDGTYKITPDFYRLTIYTEKMQNKLLKFFDKMVPLKAKIKLEKDDVDKFRGYIMHNQEFFQGIGGIIGSYRAKSFTLKTFYGTEDALATEDELKYDYAWADL